MEINTEADAITEWENLDGASSLVSASTVEPLTLTGRPSTMLYLSCDPDFFTEFQVIARKNIEFFEATPVDVQTNAQGRNKPIVLGQVGIRCVHCRFNENRAKGSQYYPSQLSNIYQAAQNIAVSHLLELCPQVPDDVRQSLIKGQGQKSSAGKQSWALRAKALGVFEDSHGLRYAKSIDAFHKDFAMMP